MDVLKQLRVSSWFSICPVSSCCRGVYVLWRFAAFWRQPQNSVKQSELLAQANFYNLHAVHYIPACTWLLCWPLKLFTSSPLKTQAYYNVTAQQLVSHSHTCSCMHLCRCVCVNVFEYPIFEQLSCGQTIQCLDVQECASVRQNQKTSGGREAESAGTAAEDGLSSLGSKHWAAMECCWVFVGLGSLKATPGLDNTVSRIMRLI